MNQKMRTIVALMLMVTVIFATGCNKDNDSDVRVTTYTPQNITQTTAKCGGDVIVAQGLSLSELGVCWSTSSKPTIEDAHLSTVNWNEPYVCTITGLEPSTKYHVRAYALRGLEYYYGEDKSFTTEGSSGGGGGGGSWGSHDYVNLGLPSGTLWATCNVGADTPEDYGDYFAWGETQSKYNYHDSTYLHGYGVSFATMSFTKYCNNPIYGYHGYTDNLTTLQLEDDAATVNWGSGWRMPTKEDFLELIDNTTVTYTSQNGVNGQLFKATNGNSIFLPAAGNRWCYNLNNAGSKGFYKSSSLYTDPNYAWGLYFDSDTIRVGGFGRTGGTSVRPVHPAN